MGSRRRDPVVATYSIAACDLERGEWGVGVQSKFLAVGSVVPWVVAEVGAVATQALANVAYGPEGLALLRAGHSAEETVARLTEMDDGRDDRQVGVVDGEGRSATFTGSACLDWAGGRTGPCFAAQGNILVSEETVAGLAGGFTGSNGPLAERLLEALAAAQLAGGDRRGQQSAALVVARREGGYGGMTDIAVDLRVDDHADPIAELHRLYELHDVLFGQTPREEWVEVDDELREEITLRLAGLGYVDESLERAFNAWVGTENLEERVDGIEQVDPVVLAALRSS